MSSMSSYKIFSSVNEKNNYIINQIDDVLKRYKPIWWANSHIQLFLSWAIPQSDVLFKREILLMQDGGQSAIDWVRNDSELDKDAPIMLIIHGICGSSDSVRTLCKAMQDAGYRVVVFNKRGHGDLKLTSAKLQPFCCSYDITYALHTIRFKYHKASIYGIGFSAGSGILSSYMSKTGSLSLIESAVFLSPGYDSYKLFCENNISSFYEFIIVKKLKKILYNNKDILSHRIDFTLIDAACTIKDIDEIVYKELNNYSTLKDYWENNNPIYMISKIKKPVLCINAEDDPICPAKLIPHQLLIDNENVILAQTKKGSHCAFFEGSISLSQWYPKLIVSYFDSVRFYDS